MYHTDAPATGPWQPDPVIGNGSLMTYHRPGCVWSGKIPTRRREDFISPDAARAAGFRPCHVCAP